MQQPNVNERINACLKKATDCERRALLATDDAHRRTYLELARLWRDMAQQVESLHRQASSL
jgi:hypothetical protein